MKPSCISDSDKECLLFGFQSNHEVLKDLEE
jgi:hypothetical protein